MTAPGSLFVMLQALVLGFLGEGPLTGVDAVEALDVRMDAVVSEPGLAIVDAGQGASLVLRSRAGELVIIDSGPAGAATALLDVLGWVGTRRVSLWVHTHFDSDHIGGFARAVRGPDDLLDTQDDLIVEALWDRGDDEVPSHAAARAYLELSAERDIPREHRAGTTWAGAGLSLRVIGVAAQVPEENGRGIALCGELEGMSFFVQGDIPGRDALELARSCGPVDLWWVGHHGGVDAIDNAGELVVLLAPKLAVISAGQGNSYCHPAAKTLEGLKGLRTVILGLAESRLDPSCASLLDSWEPSFELMPMGVWISPHQAP